MRRKGWGEVRAGWSPGPGFSQPCWLSSQPRLLSSTCPPPAPCAGLRSAGSSDARARPARAPEQRRQQQRGRQQNWRQLRWRCLKLELFYHLWRRDEVVRCPLTPYAMGDKVGGSQKEILRHQAIQVKYGVYWAHVYSCTHWLRPRNSLSPSPCIWAHIRERKLSAKEDDISL